ncbi:MAG: hypothetical protein JWO00_682 [Candidatus Parcubacteria bacterium]|nr:hypothetical protein [Candidatus Parcubacteria bacterium]
MSKNLLREAVEEKMAWVKDALDVLMLSQRSYCGFTQTIVSVTPLRHSDEWPADFEIVLKGRRKPSKRFLFIDIIPSKPMRKYLKERLQDYGIVKVSINLYSKFKTVVRTLAASLRRSIGMPRPRKQPTRHLHSYHPRMSRSRLACIA